MQFFEISKQAEETARLGRWMMDQTYNIKEDHQFANTISRLGDALTKFDMPHGTSWNSFNKQEKALIIKCKKIMEKKT